MDDSIKRGPKLVANALLTTSMALGFGMLCAWPYLRWFAHPSLFDDDFARVGSLRRATLGESLFRPFNEHMAPLFESISWICWQASGRQVLGLPLAFQVSSFLAFALTVGLLGAVTCRELRSPMAGLCSVAVYSLSAVSAETVLWYSASSFEWSAASMLAAWLCSSLAVDAGSKTARWAWLFASAMACLAAPAFSAIGLLAGPIASLRILAASRPESLFRQGFRSLVPLAWIAAYFVICHHFAYDDIIRSSLRENLDLKSALVATFEAPTAVLVPGLFGFKSQARQLPESLLILATLGALGATLLGAFRSSQRPLILGTLVLIFGGYLLAYATRARAGDREIFEVQRYHLFPQLGLAMLVAVMARSVLFRFSSSSIGLSSEGWVEPTLHDRSGHAKPSLARFNRHKIPSLIAALVLAGLLAIVQYPRMQDVSELAYRYPEQHRGIAATLKIEAICEREGITLIQAMRVLDPIQAPWFPRRLPFNHWLHLFGNGIQESRVADRDAKAIVLDGLTIDERETIFGGLDANSYRTEVDGMATEARNCSQLVKSERMSPIGSNQYRAGGRGSWLEFEVHAQAGSTQVLILPELKVKRDLEIWWSGLDGSWSPYRSVRWSPDLNPAGQPAAIALDRLPHWRPGFVRKIRLVFREWGPVTVSAPCFLP